MSYDAVSLFQNLKEGSKIDVQDQEGDWFETIVRKVIENKIICHFWGFANIWDCTIEFHPSKIAPVHSHSEMSKYSDNEKVLGECVWEILSLKNMLNSHKQCTQQSYNIIEKETQISKQNMQSFLDTMDAPDNIQLKLCKWVQKNVIEMGLHLRIQELMENGADCFGYNIDIENNIKTIENMDNIKAQISESINKIKIKQFEDEIAPLNLTNLSKISLPEISDIARVSTCIPIIPTIDSHSLSTTTTCATNTDNNSSDSLLIPCKNNNSQSRKRKQSIACKKPKKKHKKNTCIDMNSIGGLMGMGMGIDMEWLDIPSKDELQAGADGKYRCKSLQCLDKPAFKTYTSTVRHIQIEHQGYRYRCDLCRNDNIYIEFRSHSTLKIHLANIHKLNQNDFNKIRIILSLNGKDSIVKKNASSDQSKFNKWKKKFILPTATANSLEKDLANGNGNGNGNVSLSGFDLGLNLDLNAPATIPPPAPAPVINGNDKAFMNRIDELIAIGSKGENNIKKKNVSNKNNVKSPKSFPKKKDENRKPICPICGQKFKNFQALGGHKKKHNPNWGRNRKNKDIGNGNGNGNGNIQMDMKKGRLARSHSAPDNTHKKKRKKKRKKKKNNNNSKNNNGLDINFETMPTIQIQMPPPPPPKLETDTDISDQNNYQNESIYLKEEKNNKLYFKYKNMNNCIKLYPYGPLWIPKGNNINKNHNNNNNNNNNSNKNNGIEWINTKKMSVSKKYGSLILHFDEI